MGDGGGGAELVVAHRSISGSSDKILCSYTSELQMMQCWERAGGVVEGEFEVVGGGSSSGCMPRDTLPTVITPP